MKDARQRCYRFILLTRGTGGSEHKEVKGSRDLKVGEDHTAFKEVYTLYLNYSCGFYCVNRTMLIYIPEASLVLSWSNNWFYPGLVSASFDSVNNQRGNNTRCMSQSKEVEQG